MTDQNVTIPKGWKITTLGEVLFPVSDTFNFNGVNKVHFLNTGDILEGKLLHSNFVPTKSLPGQAKKRFKTGDILYSEIRPANKRYMLVNFESSNSVASTKLMVLRTRENVDIKYIYKYITFREMLNEFQTIAESRSGTFPQITFDSISKLELYIPSLPEQRAIATMLSSLDDKIELLREQNKTLEATAQAIFKEWFVNFNFPSATGKMIDSELGKIPVGWRVYKLRDLFTFVKGKKPNSTSETFVSGFLPQILIDTLDGGKIVFADSKNTVLSKEEDLVMVMDGASSGRTEFGYSGIIGSTLSLLDFKKECRAIMYFFLKNKEVEIKGSTTGSAIPHTDKEKIYQYSIAVPSNNLEELENILNSFRKKVILNRKSIQILSALRDTLLPKLMKGEVRVEGFEN